jgi:parallel beta-helix repeat protein
MKEPHFAYAGMAMVWSVVGLLLAERPAMAQMPFPAAANVPGPSAALFASPPYTCVTNFYVDAVNGNDSNPGTQAKPWKSIQTADNKYQGGSNVPQPGQCVNILPGTYTGGIYLLNGGNSNSASGYVVYRSTTPQGAHILEPTNGGGDMIMLYAPYVIIDGFEIDGNHAATEGNGVNACIGGGSASYIAHHFVAINNVIHDMGGSGLASCTADYITWRNNVVYNTSSTNPWQVSGINIGVPKTVAGQFTPTSWDNVTFGIQIAYNIAYNNAEGPSIVPNQGCTPVPPATQGPPCYHTDGNGIIIDTTLSSPAYPGNILILGNVSYQNGGGGIHIVTSQNVTVANNTVYNNYLDPLNPGTARGELSNQGSANVNWVNNIAIAVPGTGVFAGARPIVSFPDPGYPDSGTWTRNITLGAPNISDATSNVSASDNLIDVNPLLTSPATGNFIPLPGSPANGTGIQESYLPSRTPNIGAY